MNYLALVGAISLMAAGCAVIAHLCNPMPAYKRLYRWAGARIAAREVFESRMAETAAQHSGRPLAARLDAGEPCEGAR